MSELDFRADLGADDLLDSIEDAINAARDQKQTTRLLYHGVQVAAIVPAGSAADTDALERIAGVLDGGEWDADAVMEVVAIVRATGREIGEPR